MKKIFFDIAVMFSGLLTGLKVPFSIDCLHDGFQWLFPWCDGDVIIHSGSYGHDIGYLESMNFPWDDGDVSVESTDDMAEKIYHYYKGKRP